MEKYFQQKTWSVYKVRMPLYLVAGRTFDLLATNGLSLRRALKPQLSASMLGENCVSMQEFIDTWKL